MLFTCYLRGGIVYVPTMARRESEPVYTAIEPVAVVHLTETENVRRALLETMARKNILIPQPDPKALRAPPLLLKYAKAKSWSAFFRNASTWSITEDDGAFKILNYRKHRGGHWQEDTEREIQFPVGVTRDDVVDRMIAILQESDAPLS
jgi:hypothetical protein